MMVLVRKKLTARGSKQLPRKVKDRLTLREATLIESHRLDLPGVMVQVESQRNYPGGVIGLASVGLCRGSVARAVRET